MLLKHSVCIIPLTKRKKKIKLAPGDRCVPSLKFLLHRSFKTLFCDSWLVYSVTLPCSVLLRFSVSSFPCVTNTSFHFLNPYVCPSPPLEFKRDLRIWLAFFSKEHNETRHGGGLP
ncbi:unnamed protein product [Rangifer tarandus platyrhynchus]|uniref:Uncharacterized protein n=2 Tax=Rangifer tarandus platyrhynchus TaxID=3082113 RepID=A0AC59Y2L0_RANTA|nr:unnamed protein product [Rangifer tarandus platyrhynchus]